MTNKITALYDANRRSIRSSQGPVDSSPLVFIALHQSLQIPLSWLHLPNDDEGDDYTQSGGCGTRLLVTTLLPAAAGSAARPTSAAAIGAVSCNTQDFALCDFVTKDATGGQCHQDGVLVVGRVWFSGHSQDFAAERVKAVCAGGAF